jgi:nucleoside-diphosphate-sugar epimerase
MFKRILVTGYSGFVGPWVIAELRRHFPQALIYGVARQETSAVEGPAAPDRQIRLDLRKSEQVEAMIDAVRPDAVVHLASLKLASLGELLAVNVMGCERLLAGLHSVVPGARIVVIGSSSELGRAAGLDLPLDEDVPCQPVDPYGISKLSQSAIARRQALRGQDVVQVRPFNLLGPLVPSSVLPGRCLQLLRAAARASGPVELEFGPLETRRDYVDVRDLARAIAIALRKSPTGMLYHIGSGISRSGHDLVNAFIAESGMRNVGYKAAASVDPPLVPWQTADIRRARDVLGWQPRIGWLHSIRDMWEFAKAPERPVEMAGSG